MKLVEDVIVWYVGLLAKAMGVLDSMSIDWTDDDE